MQSRKLWRKSSAPRWRPPNLHPPKKCSQLSQRAGCSRSNRRSYGEGEKNHMCRVSRRNPVTLPWRCGKPLPITENPPRAGLAAEFLNFHQAQSRGFPRGQHQGYLPGRDPTVPWSWLPSSGLQEPPSRRGSRRLSQGAGADLRHSWHTGCMLSGILHWKVIWVSRASTDMFHAAETRTARGAIPHLLTLFQNNVSTAGDLPGKIRKPLP